MEARERLTQKANLLISDAGPEIRRRFSEAQDLVVFGSHACGLERNDSDLDMFGMGNSSLHYKTKSLELLLLPDFKIYSEQWLGSELANHIKAFGVPLTTTPEWFKLAKLNQNEELRKLKRIAAYLRSTTLHWDRLSEVMRSRYQVKVRREIQRLQYIRNEEPTPPTKLLDDTYLRLNITEQMDLLYSVPISERSGLKTLFQNVQTFIPR